MLFHVLYEKLQSTTSQTLALVPAVVVNSMSAIEDLILAVLCLSSPEFVDNVSKVNQAIKYSGDDPTSCLLRDTLKQEAWKKMFNEVLGKGAASVAALPEIKLLTEKVREKSSHDDFTTAVAKLPKLKKETRSGLTNALEKAVIDAGEHFANMLLTDHDTASSTSTSFVDSVIEALGLFPDRPTALQNISKLQKLKVKLSSSLALNELGRTLQEVAGISTDSESTWKNSVKPFLGNMLKSLQVCRGLPFPNETVQNQMGDFCYNAFKNLFSLFRVAWSHLRWGVDGGYLKSI